MIEPIANFAGNDGTYIKVSLIHDKQDEPRFDVVELEICSQTITEPLILRFAPEEALEVASALSIACREWLVAAPIYQVYRELAGSPASQKAGRSAFRPTRRHRNERARRLILRALKSLS